MNRLARGQSHRCRRLRTAVNSQRMTERDSKSISPIPTVAFTDGFNRFGDDMKCTLSPADAPAAAAGPASKLNEAVMGFGRVGISFQKVRLVEQLVDEVRLHSPVAQSVEMLHRVAEIGGAAGRGGVFVVAALVA